MAGRRRVLRGRHPLAASAGSLGPTITSIQGFQPDVPRDGPDTRVKSMMVAFRYDNGAVGALTTRAKSRRSARTPLSKLFGRQGVISFESNGAVILVRGRDFQDWSSLASVTSAATARCIAISSARSATAPAGDESRARDRGSAAHGSNLRHLGRGRQAVVRESSRRAHRAVTLHYDVIIIGSGAGGGPWRGRCRTVPPGSSCSNEARECLRSRITGIQRRSGSISATARPNVGSMDEGTSSRRTHYGVGGNTKFWGSVLYRLRREDFQAMEHMDGESPAWPINYDTLEPYYARAEQLYHVHGESGSDPTEPPRGPFPYAPIQHSAAMAEIVDKLRGQGLHPSHLPLGLIRPGEPGGSVLCSTCNSFPCRIHAKSDAKVCGIEPARRAPMSSSGPTPAGAPAHSRSGRQDSRGGRGRAERRDDSRRRVCRRRVMRRRQFGGAAAADPRTRAHPDGLANSSGLVGRRYMAHLATMMQGFNPLRRNDTVFQKTVAIDDFYFRGPRTRYPLGHIQSQGRTHGVMAQTSGPMGTGAGRTTSRSRGRGLARDVRGSSARGQPGHDRR